MFVSKIGLGLVCCSCPVAGHGMIKPDILNIFNRLVCGFSDFENWPTIPKSCCLN